MINWPRSFATALQLQHAAERAGIPTARARALGERLAAQPLPLALRAKLALRLAQRNPETLAALQTAPVTNADPIAAALRHLHALGYRPRQGAPPRGRVHLDPTLASIARCETGRILISPHSRHYHAAIAGDVIGLAMVLAHEEWHAEHGDDEAAACADSLRWLATHHPDRLDLKAAVEARLADHDRTVVSQPVTHPHEGETHE